MRTRPTAAAFAALALVASLGASLGLTSSADAARGDHTSAAARTAAKAALADAQRALKPRAGSDARPAKDATLALRDLYLAKGALTGADRAAAESILKRPTDPGDDDYYGPGADVQTSCGTYVCLHWVETGDDAADSDYAAETLMTMDEVHGTYVDAGYHAPLQDDGQGGSGKPDIYLSNIGPDGLYGYCTSDQPDWTEGHAIYAYCVLDNDYSPEEFSTNTPIENMQVTAAHEYFHAVQYAYDATEDGWIIEATATWAEDEVFDDVNDNIYYLATGQLGDPTVPLDYYGFNAYGNWIFFRFLTEQYDEDHGGMPALMLDLWGQLDSTDGAPDQYSTQGLRTVLADRGSTLRSQYADFGAINNAPAYYYSEGGGSETEDAYPYPPYRFKLAKMTPRDDDTGWRSTKLDHLTSGTGAFTPSNTMTANSWKLKIKVDMANKVRGSEARVIIYYANGPVLETIKLDKYGDGSKSVIFDYDEVMAVEVTLANASDRSNCNTDPSGTFACYGTPKDDRLKASVRAIAVK